MIKLALFIENYLDSLASEINSLVKKLQVNIIGPTFHNRENNITLSYNIHPLEFDIDQLWNICYNFLEKKFKELSKTGEVIMYETTKGAILDQGVEYFKVKKANIFECYIYEPESFIYLRILQEYDLLQKKQWISIDVDGIEQSAWFEE